MLGVKPKMLLQNMNKPVESKTRLQAGKEGGKFPSFFSVPPSACPSVHFLLLSLTVTEVTLGAWRRESRGSQGEEKGDFLGGQSPKVGGWL